MCHLTSLIICTICIICMWLNSGQTNLCVACLTTRWELHRSRKCSLPATFFHEVHPSRIFKSTDAHMYNKRCTTQSYMRFNSTHIHMRERSFVEHALREEKNVYTRSIKVWSLWGNCRRVSFALNITKFILAVVQTWANILQIMANSVT